MTNWYNIKERSAGELRLYILWIIYKFLGKFCLDFVVFFVAFISFIFASEIRMYSEKYLLVLSAFTKAKIKPSFFNLFKHYLSYAYSLSDKIEIFSGKFKCENIYFESDLDAKKLFNDFEQNKGVFFICNHIGNIDVMRAFLFSSFKYSNMKVNVFLQQNQTKIFNEFLKKISADTPISVYPVENIGIDTAIEIKEKLSKGEIAFMAGDRISAQNSNAVFVADFLQKKVKFPLGTFKFALLTEVPIYFVSCLKTRKNFYKIILNKPAITYKNKKKDLLILQNDFVKFLENITVQYPFQFYHFYDLFNEDYI